MAYENNSSYKQTLRQLYADNSSLYQQKIAPKECCGRGCCAKGQRAMALKRASY